MLVRTPSHSGQTVLRPILRCRRVCPRRHERRQCRRSDPGAAGRAGGRPVPRGGSGIRPADGARAAPIDDLAASRRVASGLGAEERSVVYYAALMVNVGCHSDAHEQAKWFGDDIAPTQVRKVRPSAGIYGVQRSPHFASSGVGAFPCIASGWASSSPCRVIVSSTG